MLKKILIGSSVAVVLACYGMTTGVINDMENLFSLGIFVSLVATIVMLVGSIIAFFKRKAIVGIVGLGLLLVSLMLLLCTFILIGAGQHHPPRNGWDDTDSTEVCLDGISFEQVEDEISINVQFDNQHDFAPYSASLMDWMSWQVFPEAEDEDGSDLHDYKGDMETFVEEMGRSMQSHMKKLAENTETDGTEGLPDAEDDAERDEESPSSSSFDANFSCILDNEDYITWECFTYKKIHSSASPSMTTTGITFRKADRQVLEWDGPLGKLNPEELPKMLREGFRSWAKDMLGQSDTSDAKLQMLLNEDLSISDLPLPEDMPYLAEEGIVFVWQPGEIMASGEPIRIVVPYPAGKH